jgi:hypothetical protein
MCVTVAFWKGGWKTVWCALKLIGNESSQWARLWFVSEIQHTGLIPEGGIVGGKSGNQSWKCSRQKLSTSISSLTRGIRILVVTVSLLASLFLLSDTADHIDIRFTGFSFRFCPFPPISLLVRWHWRFTLQNLNGPSKLQAWVRIGKVTFLVNSLFLLVSQPGFSARRQQTRSLRKSLVKCE